MFRLSFPFYRLGLGHSVAIFSLSGGCVHYVKRPGAVLQSGTVLCKLDLDDSSKVQTAALFKGGFPASEESSFELQAEKKHSTFNRLKSTLENIMAGYVLPQVYFAQHLQQVSEPTLSEDLNVHQLCLIFMEMFLGQPHSSFDQI